MSVRNRTPRVDERFAPVPRSAVRTVEVDGEAVLLDEETNRLHLLNATGSLVWMCLDGESTIGEIVRDLSDELDVPYDVALADTINIVKGLGDEGLLENLRARRRGRRPVRAKQPDDDAGDDPRFVAEPPNT